MSEAKAEAVEICRAFRNKGKCRYGDECKYEHSEGEEIPNPPRGPCFNWQENGECTFGDRCRFKHGDDDIVITGIHSIWVLIVRKLYVNPRVRNEY